MSKGEYYRFEIKSMKGFQDFILDDQIDQKKDGKYFIKNWESFKNIIGKL